MTKHKQELKNSKDSKKSCLIAMPGVPREMKSVFEKEALPKIKLAFPSSSH